MDAMISGIIMLVVVLIAYLTIKTAMKKIDGVRESSKISEDSLNEQKKTNVLLTQLIEVMNKSR